MEYARGHLHRPRLQAERGLRVPGLQLQFQQYPDIVGEFQRLVEHVLALDVSLRDCENVIERHFLSDGVCGTDDVGERVLELVGRWYLLPGGEEDALVELSVLREQDVRWDEAREVEYVHVVLNRDLKVHF